MDLVYEKIVKGQKLTPAERKSLFQHENAEFLIKLCIQNGFEFSIEEEKQLFDLPHAEEIVKLYVEKGNILGTERAYNMAKSKGWI